MVNKERPTLDERRELGAGSRTGTSTTVLDWLVTDRELAQIVADHVRLDFDLGEAHAVVDTDSRGNHLWDDDHVSQVGLDNDRLAITIGILLGFRLAHSADEVHRDVATGKSATCSRVQQLHQLGVTQVQEFVDLQATVEKATERRSLSARSIDISGGLLSGLLITLSLSLNHNSNKKRRQEQNRAD